MIIKFCVVAQVKGKIFKVNNLKSILLDEIPGFREFGHKFINKEATSAEFKNVSGGMGVYAHRGGNEFMARFRIPSGVIKKEELEIIYSLAKKYNLSNIHLTTRQSIQLHGLSIDEICEVMEQGIENNLYTRGAGGNYPRNVAMSPLSGVDKKEAFDVTPYAMKVNEHFLNKIYTYKLPRKMKVAFSSSEEDSAHCTATDIGFLAVKKDGKEYFRVFLGGGIGANSALSIDFDEMIEPKEILYHVEAITNLFINEGDYENKAKARIRYILQRLGKDEFIKCYRKYLDQEKAKENLEIKFENKYELEYQKNKTGVETKLDHTRLFAQKQKGLYSIYFHPIGGILTLDTMKYILMNLNKIHGWDIRLAMSEGLYIRNLDGKEAEAMLALTENLGGETRLEQSIACIGVPTCQIGILSSQNTLQEIIKLFRDNNFNEDILPSIHISGCPNSCSVHQIGEIGFSGKMKKINRESRKVFQLHVNGSHEVGKARLAKTYGDIPQEKVPEFLLQLAKKLKTSNKNFSEWLAINEEEFIQMIELVPGK